MRMSLSDSPCANDHLFIDTNEVFRAVVLEFNTGCLCLRAVPVVFHNYLSNNRVGKNMEVLSVFVRQIKSLVESVSFKKNIDVRLSYSCSVSSRVFIRVVCVWGHGYSKGLRRHHKNIVEHKSPAAYARHH